MIDYTERKHAFEKMYLHLIDRLEQAIKKVEQQTTKVNGKFTSSFTTSLFNNNLEKVDKKRIKISLLNCNRE